MTIALSGMAYGMALPEWRSRWADRRAMIVSIVAISIERGEGQLETTLAEVKDALAYHALCDRDRAIVRTTFKDIRTIVRSWEKLSAQERTAFSNGEVAPSTMAARLRNSGNRLSLADHGESPDPPTAKQLRCA